MDEMIGCLGFASKLIEKGNNRLSQGGRVSGVGDKTGYYPDLFTSEQKFHENYDTERLQSWWGSAKMPGSKLGTAIYQRGWPQATVPAPLLLSFLNYKAITVPVSLSYGN